MNDAANLTSLQDHYDRVAQEYASHLYDELRHKPLDREQIGRAHV